MPGCVKVNKENAKRDPSRNKNLVNDDPKGNVVLCDSGMPYYEPPDYRANELTWTTVYGEPEEVTGGEKGIDCGGVAIQGLFIFAILIVPVSMGWISFNPVPLT